MNEGGYQNKKNKPDQNKPPKVLEQVQDFHSFTDSEVSAR